MRIFWLVMVGLAVVGVGCGSNGYAYGEGDYQLESRTAGGDVGTGDLDEEAYDRQPPVAGARASDAGRRQSVVDSMIENLDPAPLTPGEDSANRNAYYQTRQNLDTATRDRVEAMIREGIEVDGEQLQLTDFGGAYKQNFPLPSSQAISLHINTNHHFVHQDGGKLVLQVGLQAIEQEAPRRPPLNVALVIDASGSMGDEDRLEAVKVAANQMIDLMNERDRLAIVIYSENAELLVSASGTDDNKILMRESIASLEPFGGTNIYDGLDKAFAEVKAQFNPEGLNRVVLLSDGEVTQGEQNPRQFEQLVDRHFLDHEIVTTAVGVGLSFSDDIMTRVARAGKGNFHFISRAEDVQSVLQREMREMIHQVAMGVKLRIEVDESVRLVKVFGARELTAEETQRTQRDEAAMDRRAAELGIVANRDPFQDEPGLKFYIPQFHRGQDYVVLIELEVGARRGTVPLAEVELKYKDLVFVGNREEMQQSTVATTSNRDDVFTSAQTDVTKNILGFQVGEVFADVSRMIQEGRVEQALAVLADQQQLVQAAATQWRDADLRRDSQLLQQYHTVLTDMGGGASEGAVGNYLQRTAQYFAFQRTP